MARHASALKAARQALKHREANRQTRAKCKLIVKKLRTALTEKVTSREAAQKKLQPLLNEVQRTLKKAASKNVMKMETASRHIARLSAAVHRATA
jgi:small subunit ribosomal protein S20